MRGLGFFRFGAVLALLSVTSLAISACGTIGGDSSPYKIGALFAVTGPNSPLGTPEKETALMLQEQINAKGGVGGRKIDVIVYDTESDETKAVTLAKKLLEQDKVLAIIGPSSTGESLALVDTMTKAQTPLVSAAASAAIVTPVQDKKWIFKTPQSDILAVNEIYNYLKKKSWTKVAILNVSVAFGTTGKDALEKAAPGAGIQIVAAESFGAQDTDMTAQLTKIKGTGAQAIIVWGTNPGPAIIAKNAKQLSLNIPIFNSHGIANQQFLDLAGDAANGVMLPAGKLLIASTLPDSDRQKKLLTQYAADFKQKYNKDANTFGGHAYDALSLVTKALEKSGADKSKLRDELEKIKDFVGTAGIFNLSPEDHNGLTKDAFVMIKIANGKWTLAD